jgi:uncharacterized membrane protein YgaE (UPF0421/DUF939 family)
MTGPHGAASYALRRLASPLDRLRGWLTELCRPRSPARTDLAQVGKATAAGLLAWVLATRALHSQAGWLAPATAVLLVQSTVYRSLAEGARRVLAVAVGVGLASLVASLVGTSALGILLIVPVALALARWQRIGAQADYLPATAVLLLTFGAATSGPFVVTYLWETVLGAVVGLAVNAVILPPTYQRDAAAAIRRLGAQTARLADDVAEVVGEGWDAATARDLVRRAQGLDRTADQAREILRWSRESHRWNPRSRLRRQTPPGRRYFATLDRCWHAVFDLIAIGRTMLDATGESGTTVVRDPDVRATMRTALTDAARELTAQSDRPDLVPAPVEERRSGPLLAAPDGAPALVPEALAADVRRLTTHLRGGAD